MSAAMRSRVAVPLAPSVAVVGAGLAGLTCARRLAAGGLAVRVFEKSRGLGGRLATRRSRAGWHFDHGAQFVTARGAGFRALLRDLAAAGAVRAWRPRLADRAQRDAAAVWWVGTPGMSALARPLAAGLEVQCETRVTALAPRADGWHLTLTTDTAGATGQGGATAQAGPFDRLVLAIPAAQAAALLGAEARTAKLAAALSAVAVAPCWTALLAFARPLGLAADVWRLEAEVGQTDQGRTDRGRTDRGQTDWGQAGRLNWAARDASKPGRAAGETWVLHGGPDWSAARLEAPGETALAALCAAFAELAGDLPAPVYAVAHRWRYARTLNPLGRPFLAGERLLVGGDWCLGARAEAAYDSGAAMAERLLEELR